MLKVAKGDHAAYVILYKKYLPIVTSYLVSLNTHKILVKDLAQDVFTLLWKKREEYRPESLFKTFLFGYARKVLLKKQEQLAKETVAIHRHSLEYHHDSFPELKVCREELIKGIRQAISKLPPKQKQAVQLFYITGDPTAECAKCANCSIKAFENRLFRAREYLYQLLETDELYKQLREK